MIVVLVDDDEDDLEMFCKAVLLVDTTIDCIALNGGQELLELVARKEIIPDFIFSDLFMPSVSGIECITAVKCDSDFINTKLVVYSSMITDAQRRSFNGSNVECLTKPNDFEDLVHDLKRIISSGTDCG